MTKRGYIRMLSFALALVAVLAGLAGVNMNMATAYKAQLENSYQQSLNELSENLDSIETNLTKSVYSSSDKMLMEISSDLYAECAEAKEALSRLPVEQMNLGSTYKFISQASDYASYLAQKLNSNESISEDEHKALNQLLSYSKELNESVGSMVTVCNNGGKITGKSVKGKRVNINPINLNLENTEDVFKDYPTLLYDGPFADSVLNRESELLKSMEEISKDEAREIAAYAINCNVSELSYEGEEDGNLPCYTFSFGQRNISITKRGGFPASILYGGKITQSSISTDNAVNIAKKYLSKLGYKNMASSYYAVNNNICLVNFAYSKDDTIYYADLIKVGVSMNDGKVVSLEAEGYLTNHKTREKQKEKFTKTQAEKRVSKYLTVLDSKKCVIPKENGTEALCYEIHCESKETNEEALVYINTSTGKEENILLLLYSDNGTLTK